MTIKVTYNVTDVYVTQDVSPVYINVSYSSGGGSGAAVWGGITGTLSNQTDLQSALDLKVPYTGATTNVNLGEYEIKAGQVTLDTSPTGTAAVGTTRWNDTTGLSETTLKGGTVVLKNGVDLVARVVNKVSPNTTLTKAAYQAVRVSGAQGQRLAVAFAQANNDNNSADTIGLVTETIATNQEGFIITVGQLENINTTGSLQGETWADGDVLYLSPTTAGALTNVKPNATVGHIVVIGYVEYAHANNGKIYVKVMNGWELGELHDVYVPTPSNNDVLTYETSSGLWKNKSVGTALGYTPANAATTLTINGVSYDLSANRTWSVGSVTGSGASGQVAYWTGSSSQSGSNNLFWDATNSRLGIGTATPATSAEIATSGARLRFNQTVGGSIFHGIEFATSGTIYASLLGNQSTGEIRLSAVASYFPTFYASGSEGMRLTTNRNLILQNGGTFTDSGERLQVTGDVFIKGSGATSGTRALTVQNSSSTNLLTVRNDGRVGINTINPEVTFDVRGASAGIFLIRNAPEEAFINIKTGATSSSTGVELRGLANQKGFRFCDSTNANNNYMQLWSSGNLTLETTTHASYSDVASALLQVNSTTKGFLPPRMTTTQKNAITSPAAGLVVYDTTDNKHYGYDGTTWNAFY